MCGRVLEARGVAGEERGALRGSLPCCPPVGEFAPHYTFFVVHTGHTYSMASWLEPRLRRLRGAALLLHVLHVKRNTTHINCTHRPGSGGAQ